ncbi:hypothetical protein [Velocimicrobium porci]|uniref:Bacteriocin-associated integral membrane protein n=1 Tax=Velocimicrobium porci TaxID=2606634 RepID=A0A6L5XVE9_9FIRM|nr:hypothetical protein [Velocimicrobium porci]
MQKKLVIIVVILTMLFNVFFFLHISNSTIDNFLLDKTTVSFYFSTSKYVASKSEFLNKIEDFSKENNVEIAQYSFLSADKIDIYSTMKEKYKEILFVPNIIFNRDIKVNNFDEILEVGFKNLLYIDTNDKDIIERLSETFKNDCDIYYLETTFDNNNFSFNRFFKDIGNNSLPIFSFFVFVFIIVIYFYYSVSKKRYFIYTLWGYTDSRIYYILNKPLYISLLLTTVLSNLLMAGGIYKNIFSRLSLEVFFTMLKLNLVTILFIFILSIPLFWLFCSITNNKRTKGLKKMMMISYFARILLLLLIVFLSEQFFLQKEELKEKSDSLTVWEDTQNLYNLYESYSPYYLDNLAREDILNDKMFKIYKELSELDKSFIIETINFERPKIENLNTKNQEDINYNYKIGAKTEEDLYSPHGKNIVVDKNYLKRHTIKSLDGENAIDKIDNNDNVLNILVPKKFKYYENAIQNSFKEWFYFQKVEVTNMYKEARGQNKVEKSISDLKINIIYIDNNQNLFTYNPNAGDGFNIIKDSIITVYTGNVDNSFLAACFGDYIFIESADEYSALKEISAITQKYNVIELNSIASVYDKKGREIRLVEESINNLILNTIIMSLFLVMFMIIIVYTYYKTFFSTIIIKSLHGYSFCQIYKYLILGNLFINIFVLFLLGIIYKKISLYMVVIIVLMSIIDYFISKIVNGCLIIKGEIQFIKGEQ